MKTHCSPYCGMKVCAAVFLMQSMACSAASLLVDSFDGPGGVLSGGANTRLDPLDESALFGSRWIALRDRGRQADLVATIGSGDAELQMPSALPLFTSPLPSVFFLYSSQDPIALLGSQALQLDVGSIVGRGYVYVEIDTQITPDGELNRFEITGPGLVTIPASSFSLENSDSLQGFNSFNITFEGKDPNFSLTINELRIVPEPSALFLTILGAVGLTRRRRESECRTRRRS